MSILSLLGLAKLVQNPSSSLSVVTTNRQILEAEAGEKGKRWLFKSCMIWESGKAHPLWKTGGKTSCRQPDQNQRQCPEFLFTFQVLSFGKCRQLLNSHSGS